MLLEYKYIGACVQLLNSIIGTNKHLSRRNLDETWMTMEGIEHQLQGGQQVAKIETVVAKDNLAF